MCAGSEEVLRRTHPHACLPGGGEHCAAVTSPARSRCPGARRANEDGTFKSAAAARELYTEQAGLGESEEVIAYCRIGECSSHTWFVLTHLSATTRSATTTAPGSEWGNDRGRADSRHRLRARGGLRTLTAETTTPETADLPEGLAEIVTDFAETPADDRLQVLLEFATDLPDLPEKYTDHPELLETRAGASLRSSSSPRSNPPRREQAEVRLHFSAPPESPTTRGFAGILHEGLDGSTAEVILLGSFGSAAATVAVRYRQPAAAARHERNALPDPAPGV